MNYYLTHAPINFFFKHSPRDFVVEELPLYEFTGEGEHLVLKIRKKSLATWELVSKMANHLGINAREIGYAGLKDKHAMTTQYISVHRSLEPKIDTLDITGVKIVERTYHNNKIKMGHLKGNRFFIRLKKVNSADASKITHVMKDIKEQGMPNYFGFQRFGNDAENDKMGELICLNKKKERNKKLHRLYINAYQSRLFNEWLDYRLAHCANEYSPMGLLEGDIALHYPYGRAFEIEDVKVEAARIASRDIAISGLLAGDRAIRATHQAGEIEALYDKKTPVNGERRFAWIYPTEIETKYIPQEGWMELHFTLPKGSYATVLLEQLAKQDIQLLSKEIE